MRTIEKKIKKLSTKSYAVIFIIAILSVITIYFLSLNPLNNRQSEVNLITNNIGEWNFIETSQRTNGNDVLVHTAYYNKTLSNLRNEESKVDIYEFANQASAKNELNKWSNAKGCVYVKEKMSNVVIFECFQNGIWWVSNNLLINMGSSPRIPGLYVDAYDLIVCPFSGCENEYIVYAPKAVFDAYIEKYPAD